MTMLRASPYLPCHDGRNASIDFFGRALGFEVRYKEGAPTNFAIIFKDAVSLTLTLDRDGDYGRQGQHLHHRRRRRRLLRALQSRQRQPG